jgi:urease accessory protein
MPVNAPTVATETPTGWQAALDLHFERSGARTVLARRRHVGPLQVQRPFYPEGTDTCHVYLLHPPGGVVGGDQLRITIDVASGAQALLTTPAAGKLYRSAGRLATLDQRLTVASNAMLEWLPQETIVFAGAHVAASTRVDLAGSAKFLGWELVCLGRPAAAELFTQGVLRQRFEVWCDGAPLWIEGSRFCGGEPALTAAWGLRGHSVTGTLVCTATAPELVTQVREAWSALSGDALVSATQLDAVIVCRYLGDDAEQARACFVAAWTILRPAVLGRVACPPRIWAT